MRFTINSLDRCPGPDGAGGNHYRMSVTGPGGATRTLHFSKAELEAVVAGDIELVKQAIIARCRIAVREAGATTWLQAKLALELRTFES